MAGHHKWSNVQRLLGAPDSKCSKLFAKLAKEITVATKLAGGDSSGHPRLRSAALAPWARSLLTTEFQRVSASAPEIDVEISPEIFPAVGTDEATSDESPRVITTQAMRLRAGAEALNSAGVTTASPKITFSHALPPLSR